MIKRLPLRPLVAFAMVALLAPLAGAEDLQRDERIKMGKLSNGVKWMYLQHDNPPGKMAMLIHVNSGSLNETEAQRGLAHFLEHMAFNGTENFGPGELIPYFESIGMEFGPDLNAFTSFDQTVYMLMLPDTAVETISNGLKVLSDYAFRMLLLDEEIDKERGVILSELRAGMSAQQRIRDALFEQLFAGMHISKRLPIGIEEVIRNAPRGQFEDYYRTWYRPQEVTLVMVGDAPVEQYLPAIKEWFGEYETDKPTREEQGPGLKPFTEGRAIVLSDPEYSTGDIDLYNVRPGGGAVTTVAQYREDLVDEVGSWLITRRFNELVKDGKATYRSASAGAFDFFGEGLLVNATAVGEPTEWEQMLDEVIRELNRARAYGFLEPEFALAKKKLIASAERAVRTEPTRNARGFMMEISASVNDEEPVMSAAQELALLERLLPTITLKEVNETFAKHYEPGTFAYVVTLPERDDVELPNEEQVLAAAKAAQGRTVEPWVWQDRPTEILEQEPTAGSVTASTFDKDLEITNAQLGNGVRVHHRFMDYKQDTILISVTLAGGEIEETAENAGVSSVASLVLQQPATNRLKSTEIQDIMTGKNIALNGVARGDSFMLMLSGSPVDVEIGLQLVHALLTDGVIEQSAFDTWKQQSLQQWEMASRMPQFRAIQALLEVVSGNDPRQTLMTPEKINAQSIERAQAWFDRLRKSAPIEVAVVGEMKLEEVMPLIAKYVGSLPDRPANADHLKSLRKLDRGEGPLRKEVAVETMTPQAMVIAGFIGCDATDVGAARALNLAALTLDSRLIKRIREDLGMVYSIGAQNSPGEVYRDAGLFLSGAPCEPGKGDEVIDEIMSIFETFATEGPTDEELTNAKQQVKNNLDTELKEPNYWFGRLQHLELHGWELDDLKNVQEAYEQITVEQVRETFAKYFKPVRQFSVLAQPATVEAPAEEAVEDGADVFSE